MLKKLVVLALCVLLCACVHRPQQSLYDQLGQYQGIDSLVRELIYGIAKDERIKDRYRGVNMEKFKKGLSDYICQLAAGPCEYKGDSMIVVHAGHQYTNTEFNALVGDLIVAMNRKKIPAATQNALLKVLAPAYDDIVYH